MYNQTLSHLDALQAQIAALKQQHPSSNSIPPAVNLEEQIQRAVRTELAKYIPEATPPVPLDPRAQLEKEINDLAASVLSPEDLKWLGDPVILKGVPLFLKSTRGKDAFTLLLSEYRGYVEGK
jgi:hypothetical protein